MSSFNFSSGEPETRSVLACQECAYASTTNHFRDGEVCPLCYSDDLKQVDTVPTQSP